MREVKLMIDDVVAHREALHDKPFGKVRLIIDGQSVYGMTTPTQSQSIKVDSGKDRKPLVVKVVFEKNRDPDIHERVYELRMEVKEQGELPFRSIFAGGNCKEVHIFPFSLRKGEGSWHSKIRASSHSKLGLARTEAQDVEKEIREQYVAFLADLDAEPELPEPYTISI